MGHPVNSGEGMEEHKHLARVEPALGAVFGEDVAEKAHRYSLLNPQVIRRSRVCSTRSRGFSSLIPASISCISSSDITRLLAIWPLVLPSCNIESARASCSVSSTSNVTEASTTLS